jgi:hypothetical protein
MIERVICDSNDVFVSTFEDAATARAEALSEKGRSEAAGLDTAYLIGPYWIVKCPDRADCEGASTRLGGELLL